MALDRKSKHGMGMAGTAGAGLLICVAWLLGGCSTSSPTMGPRAQPTAVPGGGTTPVQMIWQNGTAGCWGGNCGTGGITISDLKSWSTYTTVSNTMEWTVTVGGFNYFEPTFSLQNSQNQSAFANGHLQFEVELGQPVANYSAITIFAMGGSNVNLNLASLSNSSFTTVTVPLATLGTNGSGLMSTEIQFNANQSDGAVLIYFNNVEWTTY
jgi:hypothetical protein